MLCRTLLQAKGKRALAPPLLHELQAHLLSVVNLAEADVLLCQVLLQVVEGRGITQYDFQLLAFIRLADGLHRRDKRTVGMGNAQINRFHRLPPP